MQGALIVIILAIGIWGIIGEFKAGNGKKEENNDENEYIELNCSPEFQEMYSAACSGKTSAMRTLAQCYLDGSHGLNVDRDRAKYWLKKVVEKGEWSTEREAKELLEHLASEEYDYEHRHELNNFNWEGYIRNNNND